MPVPTADQLAAAGLAGGVALVTVRGGEAGAEDGAGDAASGAAGNATLATLAFMVSALVMLAALALWLIACSRRGGGGGRGGRNRGVGAYWRSIPRRRTGAGGPVLPGGAFAGALAGIVAIGAWCCSSWPTAWICW